MTERARVYLYVQLAEAFYKIPVWPGFDADAHKDGDWLHTPGGSFKWSEIVAKKLIVE